MKKYLYVPLLILGFILLMQWVVDFRFLQLNDLKLMLTLSLGTAILLLLPKDQQHAKGRFRFYLFFTALIMSLFMLYSKMPAEILYLDQVIVDSFKPFIFALVLYFPGNSLVQIILQKQPQAPPWQSELSRREKEVYELVIEGKTNKEISEHLYIAEGTVKKHVQSIFKKADVSGREEL